MTVKIELVTGSSTERLTRGISRYRGQTPIYYGENRLLTFDIYKRKKYIVSGQERVMLINKGVEYRPDLVAYDIYGAAELWWKILEANNIKDIFDFKAGRTIILPDEVI